MQIRLDQDVIKNLRKVQEQDLSRRSLSQLVNWILREAMKGAGVNKKAKK